MAALKDHTTVLSLIFALNIGYPLIRDAVETGYSALKLELGRIRKIQSSYTGQAQTDVTTKADEIADKADLGAESIQRLRDWSRRVMLFWAVTTTLLIFLQANAPELPVPAILMLIGEILALLTVPAAYFMVRCKSARVADEIHVGQQALDELMTGGAD